MLQLDSVSKHYGAKRLFDDVNWTIGESGQVIGVVGPNGAGKTTLFEIIAGLEDPDTGQVIKSRDYSVGYLKQEIEPESSQSVLDAILEGASEILELEDRLESLRQRMDTESDEQSLEELSEEYGQLESRFRSLGGYEIRSKAKEVAEGLGFDSDDFNRPLNTFSGGWRVRISIGQLLLGTHDLLLLDEPTNHLDLESIEWFKDYLQRTDQTIALISHDRSLLNKAVDQIVEVANRHVKVYQGNYETYLEEREKYRQECLKKAKEQEKKREKIQAFIDKFRYNASKASLVQSRIKKLERMEPIEVPPKNQPTIDFEFPEPDRIPRKLIDANGISKAFGQNVLYQDVDLTIWRGDRIAIAGPNGSGKTTLLKILAGDLTPDTGDLEWSDDIDIGYFAQHSLDQLNPENTIFEEVREANANLSETRIRSILGSLQLQDDDVYEPINVLSGGEKNRVLLAKILVEEHDCIFLDEPTNHLDIPSREVLEQALSHFSGVVCVVSHDRAFLEELTNQVIYIEEGDVSIFQGSYDTFMEECGDQLKTRSGSSSPSNESATTSEQQLSKKEKRRLAAQMREKRREELKPLERQLQQVEDELQEAEQRYETLESELADPDAYERDDIGQLQKKYGKTEKRVEQLMESWEKLQLEIEQIRSKYDERLEQAIEAGASKIEV
jgi:ATP-binding cassette subfamily F protein 3